MKKKTRSRLNRRVQVSFAFALLALIFTPTVFGSVTSEPIVNAPVDVSPAFRDFANTYFLADHLDSFDPATGEGKLAWQRCAYAWDCSFDNASATFQTAKANEWPTTVYAANPSLPFVLEFVSPRTIRLRFRTTATGGFASDADSLMLVSPPARDTASWHSEKIDGGWQFTSDAGSVRLYEKPWRIEIRDAAGRLLTQTVSNKQDVPFCFVRRAADFSRSIAASFALSPGEKIFGGGESFTALNKRGQKLVLWTHDVFSAESNEMYKPIPFLLSSRGYGMFFHTSGPVTCDIGATRADRNTVMLGDDELDVFIFLGTPKEIISAYTALTGRAAMPPLWSFGLWMSRITYKSEEQVLDVAAKLRENKIPCDVIHLDTGWFENDWECDYEFSPTRFPTPQKMFDDLKRDGFHVSLWQLPYFIPKNKLFPEIVSRGLAVRAAKGGKDDLPTEDAILDFSNPETVSWYQEKIAGLLRMGSGVIKVDFGEAAPPNGLYASGRTGFYEHNLYPLRYQKAVADITRSVNHEDIIWARAAWAGSQRYPVHWSGDSPGTDSGMAGTLRAGLSLGVCGFTFWAHDIGGFVGKPDPERYRRWLAFGMLTSHSRCHGDPPREPWEYGAAFTDDFRRAVELKYRLMPYIYAQAKDSSERGLPMTRALFIEFPDDPGAWLVDDAYLLGSDLLVAPLLEANTTSRDVYLPRGSQGEGDYWIDYQTGKTYAGGAWHHIAADADREIPIILLVRASAVIPQIAIAQNTAAQDWTRIDLAAYFAPDAGNAAPARGLLCLPSDNQLRRIEVTNGAPPSINATPAIPAEVRLNAHVVAGKTRP